MAGLGTIVNVLAVVAAGILGKAGGRFLTKRFQDSIIMAAGICVVFLGIGGAMAEMLTITEGGFTTRGTMMMIGSLAGGALIGELLRIEDRIEEFGVWLRDKTGNSGDTAFVNAFLQASLTICVGAMAVVGSIQDGIYADHSILFAKAILDFIIIIIMTSSLGIGCMFSAVSVGIFQGVMTLLSRLIEPFITDAAMSNLSFTGSIMIFCVGVNLCFGRKVKVGNLLPGLVIAVLWATVSGA